MAMVINMDIKNKRVEQIHEGQRYVCSYDPNAPTDKAWVWEVKYTQVYHHYGEAATQEQAIRRAKRRIDVLRGEERKEDENQFI